MMCNDLRARVLATKNAFLVTLMLTLIARYLVFTITESVCGL
jgi:hypothetical protein